MNIKEKFKDLFVSEHASIVDALELLNKSACKVLFIDCNGHLVAAISDGDIRRWLLSNGSLEAKVMDVANYSPKFLLVAERASADSFMRKNHIDALPLLDSDGIITDIAFIYENTISMTSGELRLPVVIMAGGLGTRLYPYTKVLPKPLIPIGEIPIAERIINNFRKFGCSDFYFIVNYKKNMIKAYFNEIEKDYSITFIDEDSPLGTGGGLSLLKGYIDSTFILSNCDILINDDFEKMYEVHKLNHNIITMVSSLQEFTIPYGIVEVGDHGAITHMKEKPSLKFFINTGCYFVEPNVIEELKKDENVSFPDIIEHYRGKGENVGVFPVSNRAYMDMGQFEQMDAMKNRLDI